MLDHDPILVSMAYFVPPAALSGRMCAALQPTNQPTRADSATSSSAALVTSHLACPACATSKCERCGVRERPSLHCALKPLTCCTTVPCMMPRCCACSRSRARAPRLQECGGQSVQEGLKSGAVSASTHRACLQHFAAGPRRRRRGPSPRRWRAARPTRAASQSPRR
jgi:hypothetical protein